MVIQSTIRRQQLHNMNVASVFFLDFEFRVSFYHQKTLTQQTDGRSYLPT